MSTVTQLQPRLDKAAVQRTRNGFVRAAIEEDDRSVRYVARQLGVSPSTMSERLSGKTAFHPEDLAGIARILKRDPGEFYMEWLNAAESDPDTEPPASTVITGRFAPDHMGELIHFPKGA